jgi:hypothetical protein
MKELIGKTIKGIFVNEDQHFLKFATDAGEVVYYAAGDCCSESWFADILFGYYGHSGRGLVTEVRELEMPAVVNQMADQEDRHRALLEGGHLRRTVALDKSVSRSMDTISSGRSTDLSRLSTVTAVMDITVALVSW